jgi:hypothetical protein
MRLSKKGVLVFVITGLVVCARVPAFAAALTKNYVSAKHSYSIKYPSDYKVKILGDTIVLSAPVDDKKFAFAPSVNVAVEDLAKDITDIDAFYDSAQKSLVKKLVSVDFIEQKKDKLNGKEVYRLIYTSKQQKAVFKLMQVLMVNEKKVYVLTYTALDTQYNDNFGEAKAIIGSFKITK